MLDAVNYLSNKHPIFNSIVEEYGLPVIPSRPPGFETLVLIILEQQVSISSAKATFFKLRQKVNNISPNNVLILIDEEYRKAGVSRQKTGYIKGLAQAIIEKEINLERLATQSVAQVRAELIKIKGIGHWTIDVYLMFCLQSPDIIPLGDIAVINTIKELLNIHEKAEIEMVTNSWQPHRTTATFLLWHYYLCKRNRTVEY